MNLRDVAQNTTQQSRQYIDTVLKPFPPKINPSIPLDKYYEHPLYKRYLDRQMEYSLSTFNRSYNEDMAMTSVNYHTIRDHDPSFDGDDIQPSILLEPKDMRPILDILSQKDLKHLCKSCALPPGTKEQMMKRLVSISINTIPDTMIRKIGISLDVQGDISKIKSTLCNMKFPTSNSKSSSQCNRAI